MPYNLVLTWKVAFDSFTHHKLFYPSSQFICFSLIFLYLSIFFSHFIALQNKKNCIWWFGTLIFSFSLLRTLCTFFIMPYHTPCIGLVAPCFYTPIDEQFGEKVGKDQNVVCITLHINPQFLFPHTTHSYSFFFYYTCTLTFLLKISPK